MQSLLQKVYKVWDKIPTPIKIIFYVMVAGLMSEFSEDLLSLDIQNSYVKTLMLAGNNIVLYVIQYLGKQRAKLK